MNKTYFFYLALLCFATSCKKESQYSENLLKEQDKILAEYFNLPPLPYAYDDQLPAYLQVMGMTIPPISEPKATLGRVLFYDKNLSSDRTVACASCHKQEKAFSDDVAFSRGVGGKLGDRNAMPIGNVANFSAHYNDATGFSPALLWDNRATSVSEQATLAFVNDHEMGITLPQVMHRIAEQPYYKPLWERAYGQTNEMTQEQMLEALSTFVGAMGSYRSRLDQALTGVNGNLNSPGNIIQGYYSSDTIFPILSNSENRGRLIFVNNCSKCHSPVRKLQEVNEACNGLEINYADQGKGRITGNPADNGVFKSPSLRNVALTAPYMHDGRFKTLGEVVEFYSSGVKHHANLHPVMFKNDGTYNLNLNAQQKTDLIRFLHTMTDNTLAKDERFANPFK
jgi:cytochrome c peroxidase